MTTSPTLSVIVLVLQGPKKLARCLDALPGNNGQGIEIIVPYDDAHPDVVSLQADFPDVQFLRTDGLHSYAELRALGVKRSRGKIVALTEDHCIPAPQWVTAILQAHELDQAAVGGPVEKYTPDTILNWALYFADYVRYAMPLPAAETHHLTDSNVTYKRSALDEIGNIWQEEFHEPEVNGGLAGKLWFDPGVLVWQQRSMSFGQAIRDRYAFGRLFGGRRAMSASISQRLIFLVSSIILPLLLTMRSAGKVRQRPDYTEPFLKALPALVFLNSIWALGEFVGSLTGRPGTVVT